MDGGFVKIKFRKTLWVDVNKVRLEEVWDREFRTGEELIVETISDGGPTTAILLPEGDVLLDVPVDAYEQI